MSKTWTEEKTNRLVEKLENIEEVSQEGLKNLAVQFDTTARSVGAKLRKMGYKVELASASNKSKWTNEQEAELVQLLNDKKGTLTYSELAAAFSGGEFTSKQVQGKILSMEMTDYVKESPKPEVQRKFSEGEEATFIKMAEEGASIEAIAEALNRTINSVRGKALSLSRQVEGFTIPAQTKSYAQVKTDPIQELGAGIANMTVQEIAEKSGKSERGIKTTLTRRKISCADYDGAKKAEKNAEKRAEA